ncbi:MAG: hypothetical protein KC503_19560 [Myxococcales bacterium]|nr:hypothetical protein [Myxococcales bacterium]
MLPLRRVGPVVKLGEGELGGKARVLPFLDRLLESSGISEQFAPHTISIPETWVLSTDCFQEFVSRNMLENCADINDDDEVRRRFLAASLSEGVSESLAHYLESHHQPLAIRSSALSEDTHYHPTAGLFDTHFTPNRGPNRLRQLEDAVKLVYASAFFHDVGRYMRKHCIPREDERMAVAMETVVGSSHGSIHYPLISGVAQSVNYFPVGEMKPEDGVVTLVMGLGRRVVNGLDGLRFCPRYPLVRPQENAVLVRRSQRLFDAVDLSKGEISLSGPDTETLISIPIEDASSHGTLHHIASVWDEQTRIFYDSPIKPGRKVLTFSRLLSENPIPLPSMLQRVLAIVGDGFGMPVEIEFALDLHGGLGDPRANLVLLQARPLPSLGQELQVNIPELPRHALLLDTDQTLGHGSTDAVHDIVFVDPEVFSLSTSDHIAHEVARLNQRLRDAGHEYILIGPGRWGSSNKAVGIPVRFRQIDGARLVAELSTQKLHVEPSQGTHFFHNMVSRQLFYLSVDARKGRDQIDLDWLRAQDNAADTQLTKHIVTERDISVRVDATQRRGLAFFADTLRHQAFPSAIDGTELPGDKRGER